MSIATTMASGPSYFVSLYMTNWNQGEVERRVGKRKEIKVSRAKLDLWDVKCSLFRYTITFID
jgi:hypothetical protein